MTRVNLIDPVYLTNRHLLAEYKEITQFLHFVPKCKPEDIPKQYTMGKGHCKFFYDKGMFIYKRFQKLYVELKNRGFNIEFEAFESRLTKISNAFDEDTQWKDYEPIEEAIKLNTDRIKLRIEEKPDIYPDKDRFYKRYGVEHVHIRGNPSDDGWMKRMFANA